MELLKKLKFLQYLFCVTIIFCSVKIYGQSITWTKTYSGPYNFVEECHTLCQSNDGNFFALGFSFDSVHSVNDLVLIMKLNPFGDTLWTKIVPNLYNKTVTSSISTNDGGCLFTGNGDTAYAVKIDNNGEIIWRSNLTIQSFQIFDIKKIPNNGYLLAGSILINNWYGLLIKLDTEGNLIWYKSYYSTDARCFNSIEFTQDNKYLLSGFITDTFIDTQHVQITKIDTNGIIDWEKRYLINGIGGNARRIIKINNGYLFTGTTSTGKIFMSKININGVQYFSQIFNSNSEEANWDTKVINENRYILTNTKDSTNQLKNTKIILTDSNANVISEKIFRVPRNTGRIWLESILPQNNGDLIFGGFSELYNDSTDFFLTRADSILNVPPIGLINYTNTMPDGYKIFPVYPNPFNPTTNIRYEIPKNAEVSIKVYDLLGKEVFNLSEYKQAGSYEIKFDGSNLASGVYFYTIKAETSQRDVFTDTKKMVLLK